MKSDTIIIGGGLTGLVCGINLARRGQKVIIVSSGQSALHFSSGSMELLGTADIPAAAMPLLPENHPYRSIGVKQSLEYANKFASLLAEAGVKAGGSTERNHYRITPIGEIKRAWLTLDDYPMLDSAGKMPWRSVALLNLQGYLDMWPKLLLRAFDRCGVEVHAAEFSIPELENMRRSPSEMRATNMARALTGDTLHRLADAINSVTAAMEIDAILIPAVVGLFDNAPLETLRAAVKKPLYMLPTLPTSVPGVRTQLLLRKHFQHLGGIYMLGDKANGGEFDADGRLRNISTTNLGSERLDADNFILATGGFFSHGLVATPREIHEPVFGLDVDAPADHTEWLAKDFYAPQPFMSYGVCHDEALRALRGGKVVSNLYVAGSIAGGCDPLTDECGAGVCAVTALAATERILNP